MLILQRVLILAALWLLFETSISWIATCDPTNQPYQPKEAAEEYCSAFRGPFTLISLFIFRWVGSIEPDTMTALATAAIALFTGTLWLTNRRMWKASERQLLFAMRSSAKQARQAREAIRISHDAVRAAESANKLNREIFVFTERPWMTLVSAKIVGHRFVPERDRWQIAFCFTTRNTGKTAAVRVNIYAKAVLLRDGIADYGQILREMVTAERKRGLWFDNTVPANEVYNSPESQASFTTTEIAAAKTSTGHAQFAVIGFVDYEFAFDPTRHMTPFCLVGPHIPVDPAGKMLTRFVQIPSPIRPD